MSRLNVERMSRERYAEELARLERAKRVRHTEWVAEDSAQTRAALKAAYEAVLNWRTR